MHEEFKTLEAHRYNYTFCFNQKNRKELDVN